MANARPNITGRELAQMAITLVDYINKMDQKELNESINAIQAKNISWSQWFYSFIPAIRTTTLLVSSKSNLEIAAGVFNNATCQETSENTLLLRELIRKAQNPEVESNLQQHHIATLNQFMVEKIRHEIMKGKQGNSKLILSELGASKEEKKVKAIIRKEPAFDHVIVQDTPHISLPSNKNQSPSQHQQKNFFPQQPQKQRLDLCARGEVKQPSFKR